MISSFSYPFPHTMLAWPYCTFHWIRRHYTQTLRLIDGLFFAKKKSCCPTGVDACLFGCHSRPQAAAHLTTCVLQSTVSPTTSEFPRRKISYSHLRELASGGHIQARTLTLSQRWTFLLEWCEWGSSFSSPASSYGYTKATCALWKQNSAAGGLVSGGWHFSCTALHSGSIQSLLPVRWVASRLQKVALVAGPPQLGTWTSLLRNSYTQKALSAQDQSTLVRVQPVMWQNNPCGSLPSTPSKGVCSIMCWRPTEASDSRVDHFLHLVESLLPCWFCRRRTVGGLFKQYRFVLWRHCGSLWRKIWCIHSS